MSYYSRTQHRAEKPPLVERGDITKDDILEIHNNYRSLSNSAGTDLYDFGIEYYNNYNVSPLTGFPDAQFFTPEPSFSFEMINYSIRLFMSWLRNPIALELMHLNMETGERTLLSEEREKRIRDELSTPKLNVALQKMLIDGFSLICCSPFDHAVWVPDNEDVGVDWVNYDFFSAERTLEEKTEDGGTITRQIIQGCFKYYDFDEQGNRFDQWYDFEIDQSDDGEMVVEPVDRPTMVPLVYAYHPTTRLPMGIPQMLYSKEKKKQRIDRAIYSRLTEASRNNLVIAGGLKKNQVSNMYNSKIISVDVSRTLPGASLKDNIFHMPTQIVDIKELRAELTELRADALRITGLQTYRNPNDVQQSTSTFAEEVAYDQMSVLVHEVVEEMLESIIVLYENIGERYFGPGTVKAQILHNPVDAESVRAVLGELLPGIEASIMEDPDDPVRQVSVEEYVNMKEFWFRLNKVPTSILPPKEKRLAAEKIAAIVREKNKEKEQDAATMIAQAEQMKGMAAQERNMVQAQKDANDAENKSQKTAIDIERLQLESDKATWEHIKKGHDSIKQLASSVSDLSEEPNATEVKAKLFDEMKEILDKG